MTRLNAFMLVALGVVFGVALGVTTAGLLNPAQPFVADPSTDVPASAALQEMDHPSMPAAAEILGPPTGRPGEEHELRDIEEMNMIFVDRSVESAVERLSDAVEVMARWHPTGFGVSRDADGVQVPEAFFEGHDQPLRSGDRLPDTNWVIEEVCADAREQGIVVRSEIDQRWFVPRRSNGKYIETRTFELGVNQRSGRFISQDD